MKKKVKKTKILNTGEGRNEKGQFKPGVSGNAEGMKPGTFSLTALLRAEMQKAPELKNSEGKDMNPQKKAWARLFIERMMQKAVAQGDHATQKLIFNYLEGMPKGSLDLTTHGEKINTFDESQLNRIAKRILDGDAESEG